MNDLLTYEQLNEAVSSQNLFDGKSWKLSPEPFKMVRRRQTQQLERIGEAVYAYLRALDKLYKCAVRGEALESVGSVSWVADYLDRGKPEWVRSLVDVESTETPQINLIRPDLIMTRHGFTLTEVDSLPGGFGLTAFLYGLYGRDQHQEHVMLEAFYDSLDQRVTAPDPVIAIVYDDDGETYWPEFNHIAEQLRMLGKRVYALHVSHIILREEKTFIKDGESLLQVDVVYRFFELFDSANSGICQQLAQQVKQGNCMVSPGFHHHLEEKMGLALFHHPHLKRYWRSELMRREWLILSRIIPESWIVDNVEGLAPSMRLWSPQVKGQLVQDWRELVDATKKERQLILKVSGFHEEAWGARSVVLGHDVSREVWAEAIERALKERSRNLYVMQRFHKPASWKHVAYAQDAVSLQESRWRIRLCPYYLVSQGSPGLSGVLATLCPEDKKIIHGMSDACMLPVDLET